MRRSSFLAIILFVPLVAPLPGDEKPAADTKPLAEKKTDQPVPLNKNGTVLLDKKGKRVLVQTEVVLREGLLEMLVCRKQTKEHESILSVDAKAYVIHTGLLALGANSGTPVKFTPKFEPPTGQKIDIFLQWKDEKGKPHRVPATSWVRNATRRYFVAELEQLRDGVKLTRDDNLRHDPKFKELSWFGTMPEKDRDKFLKLSDDKAFHKAITSIFEQSQPREMKADWVFAGSRFYVDEQSGEKFYEAEGGDVICVANFPTAMIDVSIESSASGEANLLFEPYTERIPPLGTKVTVELIPVFKKDDEKKE